MTKTSGRPGTLHAIVTHSVTRSIEGGTAMSHNGAPLTRRDFLGATAGMTLMSAARAGAWSRVKGAHDRVRMALIGCGNRGTQVSNFFLRPPDIEYVAAADVFKTRLDARVATFAEMQGGARTDAFE